MTLAEWLAADTSRTQETLAEAAFCSQPTISRVLQGGNVTLKIAKQICAATNWEVALGDLIVSDVPA